jgi:phosphatidylserine synthase
MSTVTDTTTHGISQLSPGVWNVDASHSTIGFSARHLMVSKVRYRSFKEIDLSRRVRWMIVSVMALVIVLVAGYPREVGLLLSFAYLLSGLLPRLRPAGQKEPRPAPAGGRDGGA